MRTTGGLPAVLAAPHVRAQSKADFLSQMIAERRTPLQPAEPGQVPVAQAVSAYANGARIAVRRMPPGYRTTILA
jgi:hypothetical protein